MNAGAAQAWFIAGTIVAMVAGGGHVLLALIETVRPTFFAPIESSAKAVMEGTGGRLVRMSGGSGAKPSMWRVWLGIHITHGLGVFTFGLLCLLIATHDFNLVERIDAIHDRRLRRLPRRLAPLLLLRTSDRDRHCHSLFHRRRRALGMRTKAAAADRIAPKPEGVGSPPPREPTRMDGGPRMRLPNTAHTSRPWRIREIAPDFTLEDVWALPVHGGAEDFQILLENIVTFDPANADSLPVRVLFRFRERLGRWFGLDGVLDPIDSGRDDAAGKLPIPGTNETSLTGRLPGDLRNSAADLHFDSLPFAPLYRTDAEFAAEASNQTVHGVIHLAWVDQGEGRYQGQMAIYVKPRGGFGKAYMALIKPFRYLVVYPALMRQIERAWNTRVPQSGGRKP